MEEILIDVGIGAALRSVKNPKRSAKVMKALAKAFVAIERAAAMDPRLAAAIESKRSEEGAQ